jgi:tRNA-Thr(GGU) m(6)t(6)A37 methyltransferase TsaA
MVSNKNHARKGIQMKSIQYSPIGVIHSPFNDLADMPVQPSGYASSPGHVEIYPQFEEGLIDLDGFSHLILLYHLHEVKRVNLTVIPFLDREAHGVFATRAPTRPNPIGLSIVKLIRIEANVVHLANLDILDQTPLLDIKPYVPEFDHHDNVRIGWLAKAKAEIKGKKSDDRFV